MAQFTKALASDYNTVRNTVADVLGTGSSTRGYGSSVTSNTVSVGAIITATQFTALASDINACYRHITNANAGSLSTIVSNDLITWANFVTYQSAATYIDTNRDTNGGTVTNPAATSKVLSSGWGNASGNRIATMTGTFTWASADAMRYFFNQNGSMQLTGAGTASTPPKDAAWATLANGVNLTYARAQYRAGIGNSQSQTTTTSPYNAGTPDGLVVSFSVPGASSIGFTITGSDKGNDGSVASNVGIDLTFYAAPLNISNTTGITQYAPTVAFATSWSYSA
jgi:hypothetical protein